MLAGGKGGYGSCFPCLVSDLLARGSSLPDKKGGNNMVHRTDTERSGLFRISRRPCQKTPHPNVLVAERRKRLGSIGGGVMRRSWLIIIFGTLAVGGVTLAQHGEHGKGGPRRAPRKASPRRSTGRRRWRRRSR